MRTQDAAFHCAELLHAIMMGERPMPLEPIAVKYSGEVVARQSTRIAESCSFCDASHMNDAFRKHENALPLAFRAADTPHHDTLA